MGSAPVCDAGSVRGMELRGLRWHLDANVGEEGAVRSDGFSNFMKLPLRGRECSRNLSLSCQEVLTLRRAFERRASIRPLR